MDIPTRNCALPPEKDVLQKKVGGSAKTARFFKPTSSLRRFFNNGELDGFAKITRDITDRKNAERELEKSRERLSAILSSSVDGIIVYEGIRDELGVLRDLRFLDDQPCGREAHAKTFFGAHRS